MYSSCYLSQIACQLHNVVVVSRICVWIPSGLVTNSDSLKLHMPFHYWEIR